MLKIGRGAHAPPFLVMDVIAAANARQAQRGADDPQVIRMEVGQPSTPAPAGAIAAVEAALRSGAPLGYTEAPGLPGLRARIALHYRDRYGLDVPPARIAVTVGASGAFPLAFLAAFDPGDLVALAAPFYPPYVNILEALGFAPQIIAAGAQTRFQPTVAMLEKLDPRPAGLIVASPCNPAGTMLHADELAAISRWCHANAVRLISDEIYHGLTWSPGAAPPGAPLHQHPRRWPVATAAALSPSAIVVNSFSKYWSMTGWRIGWMVLPEDLVRPVDTLSQNLFISAPHVAQIAAEAAMDCDGELEANVARYRRSREMLLRELPRAGFDRIAAAEGAFYLWCDVGHLTNDSVEFCQRMLAEIGIAATPGIDFDRERGRRFVRFSYCGPEADMQEAVTRLTRWSR